MSNKLSPQQAAEIGARLRAARERRGQTLQDISIDSGVNYSQLSRFERGDFRVRSKNLQKICYFLQIPVLLEAGSEALHLELAGRAIRIATQSSKNQRVIEAVLNALDDPHTHH